MRPVYAYSLILCRLFYCTDTILPVLSIGFEESAYTYYESREEAIPQICVYVSQLSPGVIAVVEVTLTSGTAQGTSVELVCLPC